MGSEFNLKRRLSLVQEEKAQLQLSVERLKTNDLRRNKLVEELNNTLGDQKRKSEETLMSIITRGFVGVLRMCPNPRIQTTSTTQTPPKNIHGIDRTGNPSESLLAKE